MTKYRKKPVVIEAVQYGPYTAVTAEMFNFLSPCEWHIEPEGLVIQTLEGAMLARIGDYIIRGVNGEFYPCKPDIFEKTYEKVED